MARKKMDLNLDLTLILTMDLNFAVGKKGIALLEVAVANNKSTFGVNEGMKSRQYGTSTV